ncbi:hypothetical protein TRVA0_004S04610 [Trichomonascus vanleenenianus]|uniref:ATP-dependent helicase n=1 Tax=Trichomonascus vanleenenianus TaxID=2268995 RepID=UPI003ECAC1F7
MTLKEATANTTLVHIEEKPVERKPDHVSAILNDLNTNQRKAVEFDPHGSVQILAGPGTGKTKTLTSRVAYLIEQGIDPSHIVVMTFTNKAAQEMKERIEKLTQKRAPGLKIGTFHSVCYRYLVFHGKKVGLDPKRMSVVDEDDARTLLKDIVKSDPVRTRYKDQQIPTPKQALKEISRWKNKGFTLKKFLQQHGSDPLAVIFRLYESELVTASGVDFDDILLKAVELFDHFPKVVEDLECVLVDEFQDSNSVQLDLLKFMAWKKKAVTFVGDPDQSIYSFRNAQPENFNLLSEYFPGIATIYLEQNYRSTQVILDHATALIRQAQNRLGSDRQLVGRKGSYLKPCLVKLADNESECETIANYISYLIESSGGLFKYSDIAILTRTNMWMRRMESRLVRRHIPYSLSGGFRIWDRVEVKTMIYYLRVIFSGTDKLAIAYTLRMPKSRGISGELHHQLVSLPVAKGQTLFDQIKQRASHSSVPEYMRNAIHSYVQVIEKAREMIDENNPDTVCNIITFLENTLHIAKDSATKSLTEEKRNEGIEFLKEHVRGLSKEKENAAEDQGVGEMSFLHNFLLMHTLDPGHEAEKKDAADQVTVSTVHSAKGKEWPVVFVVGCAQATLERCPEEEWDEERRVMFVANTRAKVLSFMTWPEYYSAYNNEPSRTDLNILLANETTIGKCRRSVGNIPPLVRPWLVSMAKFLNRPEPALDGGFTSAATMLKKDGPMGSGFTSAATLLNNDEPAVKRPAQVKNAPAKRPRYGRKR